MGCGGEEKVSVVSFKKGDQVRVTRVAKTHEDGWQNAWVSDMDIAVGKIGTVVEHTSSMRDVTLDIAGVSRYGYPTFVLEHVKPVVTPKVVLTPVRVDPQTTAVYGTPKTPAIGDLVKVTYNSSWDGTGIVKDIKDGGFQGKVYSILMQTGKQTGQRGGFYINQVELLPSPTPQALKTSALSPLTDPSRALAIAQGIALSIAKADRLGLVNIDQVQEELAKLGIKSTDLGNAAGSVFRKNFRNAGRTIKSARNNGRRVIVWQLNNVAESEAKTPAPKPIVAVDIESTGLSYVVEVSSDNKKTWIRSLNETENKMKLDSFAYTDFSSAQKEAERQQKHMGGGYFYRVSTLGEPKIASGQFKVEKSSDQGKTWEPSYNTVSGKQLSDHIFTDKQTAEQEAARQERNCGNRRMYRATDISIPVLVECNSSNTKIGTRVAIGPGYKVVSDQGALGSKGTVISTRPGGYFPVEVKFDDQKETGVLQYAELVLV